MEESIDVILDEKGLSKVATRFRGYEDILLHNLNDTLFGFVVGSLSTAFASVHASFRIPLKQSDIDQIIQRRAREIKGKIDYVLTKQF